MTSPAARDFCGRSGTYALCGLTLASDFSFASRLPAATGAADLRFLCSAAPPAPVEGAGREPAAGSPERTGGGNAEIHRLADGELLRFPGIGDFTLRADRIDCHLHDAAPRHLVELRFLGPVLACWLEGRGMPVLHASAVAVDGERSVAILSGNHGGKTSLAAALMRAGCPLLTDDLLAVEESDGGFVARPSYPQMRMWPREAEHFLGHCEGLETVHPDLSKRRVPVTPDGLGEFCGSPRPLARLYLPERREAGSGEAIEITALPHRDVVIELIRHSFSATAVEILGWQERRLDFFARLVERVPVRRLLYPAGFDHLPAVSAAILRDAAAEAS